MNVISDDFVIELIRFLGVESMFKLRDMLRINNELTQVQEERDRLQAERDIAVKQANRLQAERDQAVEHAACLHAELYATRKQLQEISHPEFVAEKCGEQNRESCVQQLVKDIRNAMDQEEVSEEQPIKYTPPNGWRLLQEGETLRDGDEIVQSDDGRRYPTERVGSVVVANQRYIRPQLPDGWYVVPLGETWRDGDKYNPVLNRNIRRIEPLLAKNAAVEPEVKAYTFAAYIVGDKSQPDALRIVWVTDEWIQRAKFGIVHRMKDIKFFGNDGGLREVTGYNETLTLNLKIQ